MSLYSDLRDGFSFFSPNQSPDPPVGPGPNDGKPRSDNAAAPGSADAEWRSTVEAAGDSWARWLHYVTGYDIASKDFVQIAKDVFGVSESDVKDMLNRLNDDGLEDTTDAKKQNTSPIPPTVSHYLNADLARQYGMDNATAYQEALVNTSYQRAVKDMQAAGLNPAALYGSGKGYTAGGVSYVSDASRSGSGSGSGSNKDYLFGSGFYNGISTAAAIVASVLAPKGSKVSSYYMTSNAAKSLMQLANALSGKD